MSALVGAAFGAAGQRCMAISAAAFVGGVKPWKDALVRKAKQLTVAPGNQQGADIGPLISPEAKQRCEDLITSAENDVSVVAAAACTLTCLERVVKVAQCDSSEVLLGRAHSDSGVATRIPGCCKRPTIAVNAGSTDTAGRAGPQSGGL